MMREAAVLALLSACAVRDARTRTIPNAFPLAIAACCLIPPLSVHPTGALAALPLLLAALACGGVGGGDVKVVAALGLVVGLVRAFLILTAALAFLVAWDALMRLVRRGGRAYPFVPFLSAAAFVTLCVMR